MRGQRWTFCCCDVAQGDKTVHAAPALVLAVNLERNLVQNVDRVKDLDDSVFVRDVNHVLHPRLHLWKAAVECLHACVQFLTRFTLFQHCTNIFYRLHRSTSESLNPAWVHLQHEDLQGRIAPVVVAGGEARFELLQACHLGFEVLQNCSSEELKLFLSHPQTCQLFRQGRDLLNTKGKKLWRKKLVFILRLCIVYMTD